MTVLPDVVPPLPREKTLNRNLPAAAAFDWLRAGWRDLTILPGMSIAYGVAICAISLAIVWWLFALGRDYILFPAIAGFMIVGPVLAIGLYEKSRRIALNQSISLRGMIGVEARSGGQILFIGVILCGLMLLWMRAAVIIYALFFGLRPFPGLDHIVPMLLEGPLGWSMLFVGSIVGGLFAAFSFAIGAFSIPMLLNEKVDAFTAMGTSMALVWNNLPVMLVWGAIVLGLFAVSMLTGTLGLILVYPLLGHGTWHAYQAIRQQDS